MSKNIAIIIPYFNAAEAINELYERVNRSLSSAQIEWVLCFVDDRSTDAGWQIIKSIAEADKRVIGYRLSRNFGQHRAIALGLTEVDADLYAVMDCDLQDRPEDIPTMVNYLINKELDCVLAKRRSSSVSSFRTIASKLFYAISSYVSGVAVTGETGNFRVVTRRVVEVYRLYSEPMRMLPFIMGDIGFRTEAITLERDRRFDGRSSYSLSKLVNLSLEVILNFPDKPLRLIASLGLFFTVLAFLVSLLLISLKLMGIISIGGFTTIMLAILGFGGLQIFFISTLGLYIGQVLSHVKKRPTYIIEETTVLSESISKYRPRA